MLDANSKPPFRMLFVGQTKRHIRSLLRLWRHVVVSCIQLCWVICGTCCAHQETCRLQANVAVKAFAAGAPTSPELGDGLASVLLPLLELEPSQARLIRRDSKMQLFHHHHHAATAIAASYISSRRQQPIPWRDELCLIHPSVRAATSV